MERCLQKSEMPRMVVDVSTSESVISISRQTLASNTCQNSQILLEVLLVGISRHPQYIPGEVRKHCKVSKNLDKCLDVPIYVWKCLKRLEQLLEGRKRLEKKLETCGHVSKYLKAHASDCTQSANIKHISTFQDNTTDVENG